MNFYVFLFDKFIANIQEEIELKKLQIMGFTTPLETVTGTIEGVSRLGEDLVKRMNGLVRGLVGDYEARLANRKAMIDWIVGSPEYQRVGEQLLPQYDSFWIELQRQFYSVGKDRYIVHHASQIGEVTFQYIISRKRKEADSFPIYSHPDTVEEGDEVVFLRIRTTNGQKIRTILALQEVLPHNSHTTS